MDKVIFTSIIVCETIDRRTYAGKVLALKIRTTRVKDLLEASEEWNIHPALTMLRLRDYNVFYNCIYYQLNQNDKRF